MRLKLHLSAVPLLISNPKIAEGETIPKLSIAEPDSQGRLPLLDKTNSITATKTIVQFKLSKFRNRRSFEFYEPLKIDSEVP